MKNYIYCPFGMKTNILMCVCSVTVMCDSLQPHGLQHTSLPCPLLPPRVCSSSYSLGWYCYLTIWSSAAPFSFCFQSLPATGSYNILFICSFGFQKTLKHFHEPLQVLRVLGTKVLDGCGFRWPIWQSKPAFLFSRRHGSARGHYPHGFSIT